MNKFLINEKFLEGSFNFIENNLLQPDKIIFLQTHPRNITIMPIQDSNQNQIKPIDNAEIVIAYAKGQTIQWINPTRTGSKEWTDFTPDYSAHVNPLNTDGVLKWRIKPAQINGWINIYPRRPVVPSTEYNSEEYQTSATIFDTRESADSVAGTGRIACIEVSFYSGKGI